MVGGGKDREEMSDLISRSEMIKAIEEHYINLTNDNVPRSIPDFYSEMQKLVYNQPTAFDTEKVVEQLEEKTDFLKDCTKYGNKDAEQQEKSYSTMMMYEAADLVEDLIDIVKKGGVE